MVRVNPSWKPKCGTWRVWNSLPCTGVRSSPSFTRGSGPTPTTLSSPLTWTAWNLYVPKTSVSYMTSNTQKLSQFHSIPMITMSQWNLRTGQPWTAHSGASCSKPTIRRTSGILLPATRRHTLGGWNQTMKGLKRWVIAFSCYFLIFKYLLFFHYLALVYKLYYFIDVCDT